MPRHHVYVKDVRDRVKFAQSLRAFNPKLGLADAMTLTRSIVVAKDLSDDELSRITAFVGDAATLHVESKKTDYELEQEQRAKEILAEMQETKEAWAWYEGLSESARHRIDLLIKSRQTGGPVA